MKIIILCLIVLGTYLVTFKKWPAILEPYLPSIGFKKNDDSKFVTEVKKQFSKDNKPAKILFKSYLKKSDHPYQAEIAKLQKMKIAQDPKSNFYVEIQLFTDEDDPKAPLIAQLRFLDVKTNNLIKESSLNLY